MSYSRQHASDGWRANKGWKHACTEGNLVRVRTADRLREGASAGQGERYEHAALHERRQRQAPSHHLGRIRANREQPQPRRVREWRLDEVDAQALDRPTQEDHGGPGVRRHRHGLHLRDRGPARRGPFLFRPHGGPEGGPETGHRLEGLAHGDVYPRRVRGLRPMDLRGVRLHDPGLQDRGRRTPVRRRPRDAEWGAVPFPPDAAGAGGDAAAGGGLRRAARHSLARGTRRHHDRHDLHDRSRLRPDGQAVRLRGHPRRRPVGLHPPPQRGTNLPQDRADRDPGPRSRDGPPARRDRGAIPDRRYRGRRPDEGPHPIARSDGRQRAIRRDSKYGQRIRAMMPPFEEQILRKILPSAEEDRRIQGVVRDVMKTLEGKIAAKGLRAKPLLVGSVAKGVHLTGTEIDIFVAFPADTPREVLEREGLVLKYGSFRGVLENSLSWRPTTVLELDRPPARTFTEPLVVVDPVDPNRNVASAVGVEQMATFVHAARAYLQAPSERFFFPRPLKPLPLPKLRALARKRGAGLLAISIPAPSVTEDVLYPQLRKAHRSFADLLHRNAFQVFDSRFDVVGKEAVFLFELDVESLPRASRHEGPPVWVKNAKDFLDKWRRSPKTMAGPYIHGERWAVDVTREATTAAGLVKAKWRELGLGKDLEKTARTSVRIGSGNVALRAGYSEAWTRLFDRRFPWER